MPPMPPNTLPATATMALKMAPRPCPSPEIVEDVVVCAPLTAAASRRATRPPREVPCLGCLIVLVNWIPEDGHPFPCSDSEASGKDDKCVRCARRSKSCFGTTLKDETKKARELAAVFNKQPLDLAATKHAQDEIKEELAFNLNAEARMYSHCSEDSDDEASQLLSAVCTNMHTARWAVRMASDMTEGPLIQRAAHVVDSASSMVDAMRGTTPPQFADMAAEEVGFF